ncbi:MAG: winged helix DNA-binding protein [Pseudomonadota bacterium]
MDDGRLTPFTDEFRQQEDEEATLDSSSDASRTGLTHRPRAQQKIDPNALNAAFETTIEGSATPDLSPPDLRPFADQLIAIAEQLRTGDFGLAASASQEVSSRLSVRARGGSQSATVEQQTHTQNLAPVLESLDLEQRRQAFAQIARATYAKRRKRTAIFGDPELFGEPGWDILLDLYIAQIEEKPVSVSSACIGSASPPTTGLRWLGVLTQQGLIMREHDPLDQRRVLVRLTDKALEAMDTYFSSSATLQTDRRAARA